MPATGALALLGVAVAAYFAYRGGLLPPLGGEAGAPVQAPPPPQTDDAAAAPAPAAAAAPAPAPVNVPTAITADHAPNFLTPAQRTASARGWYVYALQVAHPAASRDSLVAALTSVLGAPPGNKWRLLSSREVQAAAPLFASAPPPGRFTAMTDDGLAVVYDGSAAAGSARWGVAPGSPAVAQAAWIAHYGPVTAAAVSQRVIVEANAHSAAAAAVPWLGAVTGDAAACTGAGGRTLAPARFAEFASANPGLDALCGRGAKVFADDGAASVVQACPDGDTRPVDPATTDVFCEFEGPPAEPVQARVLGLFRPDRDAGASTTAPDGGAPLFVVPAGGGARVGTFAAPFAIAAAPTPAPTTAAATDGGATAAPQPAQAGAGVDLAAVAAAREQVDAKRAALREVAARIAGVPAWASGFVVTRAKQEAAAATTAADGQYARAAASTDAGEIAAAAAAVDALRTALTGTMLRVDAIAGSAGQAVCLPNTRHLYPFGAGNALCCDAPAVNGACPAPATACSLDPANRGSEPLCLALTAPFYAGADGGAAARSRDTQAALPTGVWGRFRTAHPTDALYLAVESLRGGPSALALRPAGAVDALSAADGGRLATVFMVTPDGGVFTATEPAQPLHCMGAGAAPESVPDRKVPLVARFYAVPGAYGAFAFGREPYRDGGAASSAGQLELVSRARALFPEAAAARGWKAGPQDYAREGVTTAKLCDLAVSDGVANDKCRADVGRAEGWRYSGVRSGIGACGVGKYEYGCEFRPPPLSEPAYAAFAGVAPAAVTLDDHGFTFEPVGFAELAAMRPELRAMEGRTSTLAAPPPPSAAGSAKGRAVARVILTTIAALTELQVFDAAGRNVARGRPVACNRPAYTGDGAALANLTDGLVEPLAAWERSAAYGGMDYDKRGLGAFTVDLAGDADVVRVSVYPRAAGDTATRWNGSVVELRGADGGTVARVEIAGFAAGDAFTELAVPPAGAVTQRHFPPSALTRASFAAVGALGRRVLLHKAPGQDWLDVSRVSAYEDLGPGTGADVAFGRPATGGGAGARLYSDSHRPPALLTARQVPWEREFRPIYDPGPAGGRFAHTAWGGNGANTDAWVAVELARPTAVRCVGVTMPWVESINRASQEGAVVEVLAEDGACVGSAVVGKRPDGLPVAYVAFDTPAPTVGYGFVRPGAMGPIVAARLVLPPGETRPLRLAEVQFQTPEVDGVPRQVAVPSLAYPFSDAGIMLEDGTVYSGAPEAYPAATYAKWVDGSPDTVGTVPPGKNAAVAFYFSAPTRVEIVKVRVHPDDADLFRRCVLTLIGGRGQWDPDAPHYHAGPSLAAAADVGGGVFYHWWFA